MVRAAVPLSYRKDEMPDVHPPGRRCSTRGCSTQLSRYNPTRRCGIHGGWHRPTKEDALKGDDLMELIETP